MRDLRDTPLARRGLESRARVVGAVLALLVVAALSGCSTSGPSATGVDGYSSGDGSITLVPAGDRKPAPDLSGDLVGGGKTTLSADDGKVVVLNEWASWCAPCRMEAPDLVAAAKKLPSVAFVGINTRDNEGNAESYIRNHQIPYPSFSDQDGSLILGLSRVIPMQALPTTVILDRQHRVAAAIYGATTTLTLTTIAKSLEREK